MRRFIILTLLLGILVVFFLFSDSGLRAVQYVADHNRDASWAPLVYYDIANLHATAGRYERSVEVFDLMIDVYWDERSENYVENEYGEHYAAYAFFYRAECKERIAKGIMDKAYSARQDDDVETYMALRVEAVALYKDARMEYGDFIRLFGPASSAELYSTHPLYSDANARQDKILNTIYEIQQGN